MTSDNLWSLDGSTLTLSHPTMNVDHRVFEITEFDGNAMTLRDVNQDKYYVVER